MLDLSTLNGEAFDATLVQDEGLHEIFEATVDQCGDRLAVIGPDFAMTYLELERRANQLAHYLSAQGIGPGRFVAMYLPRGRHVYPAFLAILKTGAAYLPLDPDCPLDRVSYCLQDSGSALLLSHSDRLGEAPALPCPHVLLDQLQPLLDAQPTTRIPTRARGLTPMDLAYAIYTSGSTGRPKGVAIRHRSICNLVRSENLLLQVGREDLVYQGCSISFDSSLEEIWPAFLTGATLYCATRETALAGADLAGILTRAQVTVVTCAPTLFLMLEEDIPTLRTLNFVGEPCPPALLKRWHRPGRRVLNTYGPTEATVTATGTVMDPDRPITIGRPLKNYSVYILDENLRQVGLGEQGELHIGGIGLAKGYLGSPELNEKKFIPNPYFTAARADPFLYKTGDRGAFTAEGEIEFLGRIDTQVKLRGFRIELEEIETVLMELGSIQAAAASVHSRDGQAGFIVAHLVLASGQPFAPEAIKAHLATRLPAPMRPAVLQPIDRLPMLPSGKVDRKSLRYEPAPEAFTPADYVAPSTPSEQIIASVWATTLGLEKVSILADFFTDLGGHSLLAARTVSSLRHIPEFARVATSHIYQHPTIASLAKALDALNVATGAPLPQPAAGEASAPVEASAWTYARACLAQGLGCLFLYAARSWEFVAVVLLVTYLEHRFPVLSWPFLALTFLLFSLLPALWLALALAAKWVLLGRIKPGTHPLWGSYFLRWWFVQRLVSLSPIAQFTGSPLATVFYRLMGARIGRRCHLGTDQLAAFDLVRIGDDVSIGLEAVLLGYQVDHGTLKLGTVTLGDGCFIGTRAGLGLDTTLEAGAALEDLSLLPDHGHIPAGTTCQGSPARPVGVPEPAAAPASSQEGHGLRQGLYYLFAYLVTTLVRDLCALAAIAVLFHGLDQDQPIKAVIVGTPMAAIVYILLFSMATIATKKILVGSLKAGRVSVHSFAFACHWAVDHLSRDNVFYTYYDSLLYPVFLRLMGATLGRRVEISEQTCLYPDLVQMGDECFSAGSACLGAPRIQGGHAQYGEIRLGQRTLLGNRSVIPGGVTLADKTLIGCTSVPPDGAATAVPDTAWFGSPPMQLPRRELIAGFADDVTFTPSRLRYCQRFAIELFRILPVTFDFVHYTLLFMAIDDVMAHAPVRTVFLVFPLIELLILGLLTGLAIALKWLLMGREQEAVKPAWSTYVWRNDLLESLYYYFISPTITQPLIGTPFLSMLLRAFGARIGKRAFIDTDDFSEFDLTHIGDHAMINKSVCLQTHLFEDRIFKTGTIKIGKGCQVGAHAVVLYDTVMEDGASLGPVSLLMKGETLPADTRWEGLPAQAKG